MNRLKTSSRTQSRLLALYLMGIAAASGLIYYFVFNQPANYLLLEDRSGSYYEYLSSSPPATRYGVIAAFVALAILYGLGYFIARRMQGRLAWGIVLIGSLAFGVLLSYIYPIDSPDLFNNIMYGRISAVHHANPFIQAPSRFQSDEFFSLVGWGFVTSAYGPVWELFNGLAIRLAGTGHLANVLAEKWLVGLFLLASAGVIAAILKKQESKYSLAGVLMFAWNPVLLFETWGNGHNDIAMVFFILLAIWVLLYEQHTLAILALVAGALVKFIPVLLIPAAGLIALRDLPNRRARFIYLALTAYSAVLLIFLAYLPYWTGLTVLNLTQKTHLFATSLPAILYWLARPSFGQNPTAAGISTAALIVTLLFCLWQGWQAYRNRSLYSFAQASFNILAFYLLVTCLWWQQWYVVWLIGLAPVLASGEAQLFAVAYGFLGITKQLFVIQLVIRQDPLPRQFIMEAEETLGVQGLPWLLALALLLRKKITLRFFSRRARSQDRGQPA